MGVLNIKTCGVGGNTGYGDCFLNPKNIAGGILVPSGREYTPSETASAAALLAAIQADILKDADDRAYPLAQFEAVANNSVEPAKFTLGYGRPITLNDGMYEWRFQFIDGGLCLTKSLRKFNGTNKSILLFDADGLLLGWKSGVNLKGIPLKNFYALPMVLNDYANPAGYHLDIAILPTYLNDLVGFVEMNIGDLSALRGLQNIVLVDTGNESLPSVSVKLLAGCKPVDLYDLYASEFEDELLWTAMNEDGEPIAITSVTKDDATKAWIVLVDDQDANYPVSGPVIIGLASPQNLADAGIIGYEGLSLTVS